MAERLTPEVLATLRDIIERQIAADDPPETAATLSRLRNEGIPEDAAWRMISAVLQHEMGLIFADGRTFNREGYISALNHLPGTL